MREQLFDRLSWLEHLSPTTATAAVMALIAEQPTIRIGHATRVPPTLEEKGRGSSGRISLGGELVGELSELLDGRYALVKLP